MNFISPYIMGNEVISENSKLCNIDNNNSITSSPTDWNYDLCSFNENDLNTKIKQEFFERVKNTQYTASKNQQRSRNHSDSSNDIEYNCKFDYNGFEYLLHFHSLTLDNNQMIIFTKDFMFENVCKEALLTWWITRILKSNKVINTYIYKHTDTINTYKDAILIYITSYSGVFHIEICFNFNKTNYTHTLDISEIYDEYYNACGEKDLNDLVRDSQIFTKFRMQIINKMLKKI